VVAVIAATLVLVAGCGSDEPGEQSVPKGVVRAGIVPIDGFADRQEPAVATVGDRLFVFGGRVPPPPGRDTKVRYLNDAVLVDPTSGASERLPDPPFDKPLAHPIAQRIGEKVLVLGSECIASEPTEGNAEFCEPDTYAAATFDPRSQEWRKVDLPADLRGTGGYRRSLGVLRDGRAALVLGSMPAPAVWTYEPDDGRWEKAPVPLSDDNVCLAGSDVVERVLTEDATKSSTVSLRVTNLETGAVGDASQLPGVTYRPFMNGSLRCQGSEILVVDPGGVGGAAGVHRYDRAAGTWSTLPAPPVDLFGFRSVWADDELLFLPTPGSDGEQAYGLEPSVGRWRAIADPPANPQDPVWDGHAVLGYAPSTIQMDSTPAVVCGPFPAAPSPTSSTTSARPECRPDYRPPAPRRTHAGVWSFTVPPA
jgi:hypothetical protein